ncbi:MAG: Asp-tRNA(Asn)/Glu-tRNA(Gln) amidotransferase subunit GatC [Nitrospirae bacterium]|nr:Asp-tRNA(Asn)/Glu-tRNA(Gln) amidotransferase subunit GatC [Nitrospirota bacterium]MCL5421537.1 Asp-tRNA(Asn)/Glu-tRNA(Gln) amidotransferase subunit GatC [Nitrospirota bacterium]
MKIDVEHIAHLARLRLSEEEKEKFGVQLSSILTYVEKLNELDTSGVEPTSHVLAIGNVMREDALRPSLSTDEALRNAPDRADDFYRVPKIIE